MHFLPIATDFLHEDQINCLIVEGTITRDFGPWQKGEKRTLTFDFDKGTATEYDTDGSVLVDVKLELVVK